MTEKLEEKISYEIVYEPDTIDAHGQWMSKETVMEACHSFNKGLKDGIVQPNLFHLKNTNTFEIVDTWINKELDVNVEATGEPIKAGAWIAKLHYLSDELWQLKKDGVLGGVSIGARGNINEKTGEITNVSFDWEN